jgi:hypothetical protein
MSRPQGGQDYDRRGKEGQEKGKVSKAKAGTKTP